MGLIELAGDAVTEEVQRVLEFSHASPEGVTRAADRYRSGEWQLYGWTLDAALVGCIGFERATGGAILRSLAVIPSQRRRGIGRAMLDASVLQLGLSWIEAETDADSVRFYERLGFSTSSLGETYPGVERFKCVRASFTET